MLKDDTALTILLLIIGIPLGAAFIVVVILALRDYLRKWFWTF